jgi:hypothetical protein
VCYWTSKIYHTGGGTKSCSTHIHIQSIYLCNKYPKSVRNINKWNIGYIPVVHFENDPHQPTNPHFAWNFQLTKLKIRDTKYIFCTISGSGHPFSKILDLPLHLCMCTNVSFRMQEKTCLPAYFVLFISENFKQIQYRFISCSLWMRRWPQLWREALCQSQPLKSFSSVCETYHKMRWDSTTCIYKKRTDSFVCEHVHVDVCRGFYNLHHENPK